MYARKGASDFIMEIAFDKTTQQMRYVCVECKETCKVDFINEKGICRDCDNAFCELGETND